MTREELQRQYTALSTHDLLEIVDRKFDYTDLAVLVALEEIGKRQLTEDDIKAFKQQQIAQAANLIKRHVIDDLTVLQKNFFFFVWLPLINFPFRQNFKDEGYMLKLQQANYYSLFGFISYLSTSIITAAYQLSIMIWLALMILSFLPAYGCDEFFNRQRQIRRMKKLFGKPK